MELLTIKEVANMLKVSTNSVYRYMSDDKIKTIKFEGNTRIEKKEIDRFIGRK